MAFDIGITESPIVSVELDQNSTPNQVKLVKERLENGPGIESVTDAIVKQENLLGIYHINTELEGSKDIVETVINAGFIGIDYCNVFDIEIESGRNLGRIH